MPALDRSADASSSSNSSVPGTSFNSESPKRKRTQSIDRASTPPAALSIDTASAPGVESAAAHADICDSPRSKVADRFAALDLKHETESLPRKRTKTRQSPMHMSVPTAALPPTAQAVHEVDKRKTMTARPASKRPHSPPPALSHSPDPLSSHPESAPEALNKAVLTWQEAEITGHEIDATSPDDDGEGINGVGFRPTPTMAYARSQKRKQQVHEWKAREAKEARQRRFRRRQGCATDAGSEQDGGRRMVRFADVS